MEHPRTLQVVGFRKSGKTTLINAFIRLAKHEGATVVTLKHHGHPSPLALPDKETDSMQHFREGADMSIVYGNGIMQTHERREEGDVLSYMYREALKKEPDYIFIEGFKQASFPKIVLIRNEEDKHELLNLQDVEIVADASGVHEEKRVKGWWEEWKRNLK